MSSSLPLQLAETIQTASLNRAPSPTHDLNPSTAASAKEPVTLSTRSSTPNRSPSTHNHSSPPNNRSSTNNHPRSPPARPRPDTARINSDTARTHSDKARIHSPSTTTLRPIPRHRALPPLPDLRFEQSYLASLRGAEGWAGVGYVTVRDQVLLPLLQGTLWTLLLSGWRHWNRTASYAGAGVGARVRRWWWGVNGWAIPGEGGMGGKGGKGLAAGKGLGAGLESEKLAGEVTEFYHGQIGAGLD